MAQLTDEQKAYLVTRFACFASPSEVIEELKIKWKLVLTAQQVVYYNATVQSGQKLATKWKTLFDAKRSEYIASEIEIPCTHRRWRLERIQKMLDDPNNQRNKGLIQSLLKQAAEESGGAYTNKRELSGPGGGPIAVRSEAVEQKLVELAKYPNDELVRMYREQNQAR
jgi:hypothetical protein